MGKEDQEKELNILLKNVSLQMTLKNIDKSLKELKYEDLSNKSQIKETKEEFKKKLLEKVQPVGSYYWSDKNINPGDIFGGTWTPICGKFLFSSDSSHPCGSSGGEERVTLSISEIPSHTHGYLEFDYHATEYAPLCSQIFENEEVPYRKKSTSFYKETSTQSSGGNCSHNNMPPYIAANCWKRIS